MRFLSVLLLLTTTLGCSPGRETVENAVKQNIARAEYVEFEDFKSYDNDTVCGRYMGLDHMGNMHGFRPFIYTSGLVDVKPTKADIYIFCSSEQAARLQEVRNFSIAQDNVSTYMKIRDDFAVLDKAISFYVETHKTLPSSLDELVTPTKGAAGTVAPEAVGVAVLDPWGNTYHYQEDGWGGVALDYQICTQGADGEPGGVSINTDICKADLRYFSILLNL